MLQDQAEILKGGGGKALIDGWDFLPKTLCTCMANH